MGTGGKSSRVEKPKVLPFHVVRTNARFALYSESEGLISEHDRAGEAIRGLAAHVQFNSQTKARIYERTPEGWEAIL
jgi:hypothetical protein